MSCSAKAKSLIYSLPLFQRLADIRARPTEAGHVFAPGFEAKPQLVMWTDVRPLLWSVGSIGVVTALLFALNEPIAANLVPIAYLIPIIYAATRLGIWSGTLASLTAIAAADFFFFSPLYSLRVDSPQEAIDLLVFLVVALVSSNLASRLQQETERLRRREREIQHLYEFSKRLAACFTISDLIDAVSHYLAHTLGQRAALFVASAGGHFESSPELGAAPPAVQESVAAMTATVGVTDRSVIDESTQEVWLLRAVGSKTLVHGVIAINAGRGTREAIALRTRRIEAVLEEVSLTLQRLDIGKAMDDARMHLQAELLRDAFHGTLSHELCSPLAAIQGSVSVMHAMPAVSADERLRSLIEAVSDEVARLDGHIRNLLNATRVTAGGLTPRLEWSDPRDIVNAAVKARAPRLAAHRVEIGFDDDLPLLNVDSGLLAEACGQLLENAAKYSPSGSTISVQTRHVAGRVVMSIIDQGVGVTLDEQRHLGRKSFRSPRHQASVPGSGLGFWIASTFVRAHDGTVEVASRGHGLGTTASILLPAAQTTDSDLVTCDDE
ncbi:K+-sensing histidine kinase KdpD [Bradyrhizobium sp. USDA 4341]